MHCNPGRGPLFLTRCGLAVLAAVLPKGRFISWTQNTTRSWKSCTATTTRWRRSALLRIGTSSVELENKTEKSPSGRWSRGEDSLKMDGFVVGCLSWGWSMREDVGKGVALAFDSQRYDGNKFTWSDTNCAACPTYLKYEMVIWS